MSREHPPCDGDEPADRCYGAPSQGLTKREAFAMAALQGFCANVCVDNEPGDRARAAVKHADELIMELNK